MLKKSLLLVVALLLLIVPTVSAQTVTTSGLDAYFPQDTALYATIRTDAGYIETLDAVLGRFAPLTAAAAPGIEISASGLLNLLSFQAFGAGFQNGIRPWLGDSIAAGIMDANGDSVLIVVEITDRARVEELATTTVMPDAIGITQGDYTVFSDGMATTYAAVGDSVLVLATSPDLLPVAGMPAANLTGNTAYTGAVGALTAESYNILMYVNTPAFSDSALAPGQLPVDAAAAVGPTLIAATILDGDSLAIDIVQDTAGTVSFTGMAAVDPAFMANVPASAGLLVHGTNLKSTFDSLIQFARSSDPESDIDASIAQIEQGVQQLTGLSFENDILGLLTDDYVLYMSYAVPQPGMPSLLTSSVFPGEPVELGLDFGIVVENVDPARAQTVVDALAGLAQATSENLGATVGREMIGGANALTIEIAVPPVSKPVSLVIGANERVFVMGTRLGALAALEGSGGLNADATFAVANQYALPDANSVWYMDDSGIILMGDALAGLAPAIDSVFGNIVASLGGDADTSDMGSPEEMQAEMTGQQEIIRLVASLFDSGTISTATVGNYISVRMVITVSE